MTMATKMIKMLFGILSLIAMGTHSFYSVISLYNVKNYPLWCVLGYMFTIFGSYLGVIYELFLFEKYSNEFFARVRVSNVPLVISFILYAIVRITFQNLSIVMLDVIFICIMAYGFLIHYIAFSLGPSPKLVLTILFEFIVMGLCVWFSPIYKSLPVKLLFGMIIFQAAAYLDKNAGTIFHVLNMVGGICFYEALISIDQKKLSGLNSHHLNEIIIGVPILIFFLIKIFYPKLHSHYRQVWSNLVWITIYANLLALPTTYPVAMTKEKYENKKRIELKKYSEVHPLAKYNDFSAADHIPDDQKLDNFYETVKSSFDVIRFFDIYFPQARCDVSVMDKPRVQGNDFVKYFPGPLKDKAIITCETIQDYYKNGQLLAYLVQYGHASSMLMPVNEKKTDNKNNKSSMLMRTDEKTDEKTTDEKTDENKTDNENNQVCIDFTFMSKFPVKEDFHKYGGKAWFEWENKNNRKELKLLYVAHDDNSPKIPVNPQDPTFRKIESIIVASSLANTVVGKHCAGIHSYFNLVAISIHNAFDTKAWKKKDNIIYPHPFRLMLQVHFYNHILVEELTTGHLLEESTVFSQIFAFTSKGLSEYYNYMYKQFEFAEDADFETRLESYVGSRKNIEELISDELDPDLQNQLAWEKKYHEIYFQYSTNVINAIYQTDEQVKNDVFIQDLKKELLNNLPNPLPERFTFDNKKSLARFFADLFFCISIRHEIYGRISTNYGNNFNIVEGQIPIDNGKQAIEDYISLVCVALATSQPNYLELQKDFIFLLEPLLNTDYYKPLIQAMNKFQDDLTHISRLFTQNIKAIQINKEYNRPVPKDLCPGSCY